MRFKEFLLSEARVDNDVKAHLKKLGYKFLGGGADQLAYLEPKTGKVLKIFGNDRRHMSDGQRMFRFWKNYCDQHSSNQFLPKIEGFSDFTVDDKHYLQIRMEKLQKLPRNLSDLLENMARIVTSTAAKYYKANIYDMIGHEKSDKRDTGAELNNKNLEELNKLVILLGKDEFDKLWDTLAELYKLGKKQNYHWDLHGDNFMHRNDGIPVIVDPWIVDTPEDSLDSFADN